MKNRMVDLMLIVIIGILIIGYFTYKNVIIKEEAFLQQLVEIEKSVENKNWDQAQEQVKQFDTSWKRIRFLVMINYAEADFATFEESLNSLQGSVMGEDDASSLQDIMIINDLWSNFNKIVPAP